MSKTHASGFEGLGNVLTNINALVDEPKVSHREQLKPTPKDQEDTKITPEKNEKLIKGSYQKISEIVSGSKIRPDIVPQASNTINFHSGSKNKTSFKNSLINESIEEKLDSGLTIQHN
jgi:hypothetical protein